jgi:probable rRNA maturation factor
MESLENRRADIQVDIQVDDEYAELVDVQSLVAVVTATLRQHPEDLNDEVEVALVVTSDEAVQALNRDYRGIDSPTDVLSFSAQEAAPAEPDLAFPAELAAELDRQLGDIVIAYPYASGQAQHFGNSVAAELRLLAIHGTLHLLGYDHATPEEEEAMWAEQEAILSPLGEASMARRTYAE